MFYARMTLNIGETPIWFTDIKDAEQRLITLRLLVALLPTENQDTLWKLLAFLNLVVQNSADLTDKNGGQVRKFAGTRE